jgi:hypothetical protein
MRLPRHLEHSLQDLIPGRFLSVDGSDKPNNPNNLEVWITGNQRLGARL